MRLSFLQKTEVISTCTLKGIIISHSTSERNSKQSSVYQPMNRKRFKLDMFETMRRNLPLLLRQSFGVGRAVAPLRCRNESCQEKETRRPNCLGAGRWLGHTDFVLWPPGFPVSGPLVVRVWLWPFTQSPLSFTWQLPGTDPKSTFCPWKQHWYSRVLSLCLYECVYVHVYI